MALVPLTRLTFHTKDGDQYFYFDWEVLSMPQRNFILYECHVEALTNTKLYDYVVPGFFRESDIAQFKEVMGNELVTL